MQNKNRFLFVSLAGILMALTLFVPDASASAEGNLDSILYDSSHPLSDEDQPQKNGSGCLDILWETVNQSGNPAAQGEVVTATENGFTCHLYVDLRDSMKTDQVVLTIQGGGSSFDPHRNNYASMGYSPIVFHGYPAMIDTSPDGAGLVWWVPDESGSFYLEFDVYVFQFQEKENVKTSPNPTPMAEILYSIVQERRPELNMPSPEQSSVPVDPGEVVPGQPEVPIDETVPTDTGGLFGIPAAIILGSLGIPVAGALAGAVVSSLVSLLGSSSPIPVAVPEPDTGNDQGLYWSERPWDEAGPGYVPKEEYERTKDMLAQGYKWTNGGWQTPDQIKESNQLQQNDRAAIAREDAKWRANRKAEQQALEQNEAELKKRADELQAAENLTDLTENFESINQELLEQNTYVLNPYQGDPTVVFHRLNTLKNVVWDNTGGRLTGANGLTCEGYVDKTSQKTLKAVANRFPGAKVQRIIFEEKSTVKTDKSWGEWFDSLIDDNHNLTKIILPDGSEWALDFHQHNAGNSPLMRPWQETRQAWRKYMGDDFIERVSSETIAPKPRK